MNQIFVIFLFTIGLEYLRDGLLSESFSYWEEIHQRGHGPVQLEIELCHWEGFWAVGVVDGGVEGGYWTYERD